MMLSRTQLAPSAIQGIGLFAAEDITQGTPVWQYTPGFDLLVDAHQIDVLSPAARDQFLKYAYLSKKSNKFVLCFDDARFFNHSSSPNVSCPYAPNSSGEEDICFANRDIRKGEELTCDYREFDDGPAEPFTD